MALNHLAVYIQDHLTGAAAAIEIMDYIESSHPDTPAGAAVRQVRADIIADRDELSQLGEKVGEGMTKGARRLFGWLAEKATELKLVVDDPSDGTLRLLESVEVLAMGIDGKMKLWSALSASCSHVPELASLDYARLLARAGAQQALVEPARVAAAKAAFVAR